MVNEKPRRSRLSIRLRTLLLVMLASGCGFGLIGREVRQAQRREEAAKELARAASKMSIEASTPRPAWQRRLLGEHFFKRITAITIDNPGQLPADGRPLGELKHLKSFEYNGNWPRLTDRQVAGLAPLRRLESVTLSGAPLRDEALSNISSQNPLRDLNVSFTSITDAGLERIAQFESLESLDVSQTLVTDEGLKHLTRLPKLRRLKLCRVQVSDEGLKTLAKCPSLESLELAALPITKAGIAYLDSLPPLKELRIDNVTLPPDSFQGTLAKRNWKNVPEWISPPSVFWAINRSHIPRNTPYMRWLLEHGADPDEAYYSMPAVSILVARDAREPIEVLLEFGADLRPRDGIVAPLGVAAQRGNLPMMQFLLERGAPPNSDKYPFPVMVAAYGRHVEAVRLLIAHGADVNCVTADGATPLHVAAYNAEIVRLLLEAGADPNALDKLGNSPLHQAAAGGAFECSKLLLEYGADASAKNAGGRTPLDMASERLPLESEELVELLESQETSHGG